MRVQIASLRQNAGPPKSVQRQAAAGAASAQQNNAADLAAVTAERIKAIRADDPEKNRKALRIFLESVLLGEFGMDLIEDPEFARMVDHVQHQLESEPELARSADQAAELLLQQSAT
jgi:hypothetical protein